MTLSIIIPVFNEAAYIGKLLTYLLENIDDSVVDVIVSDGGSTDETINIAKQAGVTVTSSGKGRSIQMNSGARAAKGEVLYFVHADSIPPKSFIRDIQQAINDGFDMGRYRTNFDSNKIMLKVNAWFTRYDLFACMGGDQTLFIKRSLFETCNGFDEKMKIMEEYEFCERARKVGKYKIFKKAALVSARKYDTNSWLKVQLANARIVNMYLKGFSQDEMYKTYRQRLHDLKNV